MHVLGRPGQLYLRSPARQLLALGLVGVRHQHGHPDLAGELHDHLGRGAQVQGALHQALDARVPPAAVADLELLGAHHRVAALSGVEAVRLGFDRDAAVQLDLAGGAALLDGARHQVGDADEARHEGGRRPLVDLLGVVDLLDPASVHDRDPVGHRQRLLLVVGHVDERDPDVALDLLQLYLQALAQLQVERAEGLVQQQDLGQVDQRPGQRHALLLAARELGGPPVGLAGQPDALELLVHAPLGLGLVHLLAPEAEGDVVRDAQVGEQRVALEDGVGRPPVRRQPDDVGAVDQHLALGRLLESGDHPQRGRLAAAARAQQGEELPFPDRQAEVVDRREVAELLGDVAQLDAGLAVARLIGGWGHLLLTGKSIPIAPSAGIIRRLRRPPGLPRAPSGRPPRAGA